MHIARWTAVPLALMLVVAMLLPSTALAHPRTPFAAFGTVETIDAGTVRPAGKSGLFEVTDRTVTGTFVSPELAGPYTFTFDARVTILQEGRLNGTLTVGDEEASVRGGSALVAGPAIAMLVPPDPGAGNPGVFVGAAAVGVQGEFAGELGKGTFQAVVWVMLDAGGHIIGVLPEGTTLLNASFIPVGVSGLSFVSLAGMTRVDDDDDDD